MELREWDESQSWRRQLSQAKIKSIQLWFTVRAKKEGRENALICLSNIHRSTTLLCRLDRPLVHLATIIVWPLRWPSNLQGGGEQDDRVTSPCLAHRSEGSVCGIHTDYNSCSCPVRLIEDDMIQMQPSDTGVLASRIHERDSSPADRLHLHCEDATPRREVGDQVSRVTCVRLGRLSRVEVGGRSCAVASGVLVQVLKITQGPDLTRGR